MCEYLGGSDFAEVLLRLLRAILYLVSLFLEKRPFLLNMPQATKGTSRPAPFERNIPLTAPIAEVDRDMGTQ